MIQKHNKMKRIYLSAVVLSAAILLSSFSENTSGHRIGLQLYSLRDAMGADPVNTIEKLGTVGYEFVEAADYKDGKFYGMDPEAFKALVEENGMIFLGSHAGHDIPDSGSWKELMPWWDECIAAHKTAGVEYIVQPSMADAAYQDLEILAAYCEYFNEVGRKCNEAGLRFGYHNHDREFGEIDGKLIYDYMLRNTDPGKVMFQLDLYWIDEGGGDAMTYFEKYPDRFGSIHIKDKAELGASGNIDFPALLDKAVDIGAKYYVVELEEYNFDPLVSVEKSLDYLKKIGFTK